MYPGYLTITGPTRYKKGHVNARYVPDDPVAFAADEMKLGWGDVSPWLPRHIELLADPVEESAEQRVQNLLEVHRARWGPRPKGVTCDCEVCKEDRRFVRARRKRKSP